MKRIPIVIKYILLFVMGYEIINRPMTELSAWRLTLYLLYVINMQMRIFILRSPRIHLLSCLIDLGFLLSGAFSGELTRVCVWTIYMMDIFQGFGMTKTFMGILGVGAIFLSTYHHGTFPNMGYLGLSVALLLIYYLQRESDKAENRWDQELIEKLARIQELEKDNRSLELYIGSVKELYTIKERNRISRELHDSIGHSMSAIIINLGAIEKMTQINPEQAGAMAAELREFSIKGMNEIRSVIRSTKPARIDEKRLNLLIEELITEFQNLTDIEVIYGVSKQSWALVEDQELVLYRAVQEFLSNAAKHAEAKKIHIFLNYGDSHLVLSLRDDGIGADQIREGTGLKSLKERVYEIGGTVEVTTSPGKGFSVRILCPRMET
ncbi:MAG: sensor histidine kinase [Tissierellia bacterium]|nr:sensor histidine kinase [Tissierellia bacterium]